MATYFDPIHPDLNVRHDDVCNTVNDYLHYVAVIKGRSLQTVFNYYVDLREFYRFMVQHRNLCTEDRLDEFAWNTIDNEFVRSITSADILEFLYMLQRKNNCKATTRNRKLSSLRGYFRYLLSIVNLIEKDPTANMESAKTAKTLPKYLTAEQSVDLLNNVRSDSYERDFCIITLFLNCGMRLTELVKINISDIHDDVIVLKGKGNKERLAYLTPACIEALTHYLRVRLQQQVPASERDALFVSRRGTRLTPRRVEQIVEHGLKNAGLDGKGYSPHKLRPTAATLMYQSGNVDILELKELLGHANVATTQIYTHLDQPRLRDAVNASPLSGLSFVPPPAPVKEETEEPEA